MLFRQLFDKETSTFTYLIADSETREALLVDPVLEQVDRDLQLLQELELTLRYCLETHIHADHITGAGKLRQATQCLSIVPFGTVATCADYFLKDGEILQLGSIWIEAIATPGHTDSHLTYRINRDRVLTGDTLLIRGCGRTDFQGGDAGMLYDSVTQRLFALPATTQVYPGHDYRGYTVSTIGEEKRWNARFVEHRSTFMPTLRSRHDFIELMKNLKLANPQKMMEAIPANQNCGSREKLSLSSTLRRIQFMTRQTRVLSLETEVPPWIEQLDYQI